MIRNAVLALLSACLASALPLLRHDPVHLNMLEGLHDFTARLGIDPALFQDAHGLTGRRTQASGDYFFVQQNDNKQCEDWFAGNLFSTDLCFGTLAFECKPADDNDGPDAVGRRLQKNATGDIPVIQYFNPFLTANCTGEPDEEQEFDDPENCEPFDAGTNTSTGLWIRFACGVPDTGVLIIPDCEHDETNFLTAQIIATERCFQGQEFSCANDGSTIVTQFANEDCTGQSRSAKIADPGECVQGSTFICLG